MTLSLKHQPALSPFFFGIWDDSGGPRMCVCVEREKERVGTYCMEVCRSKREGVALFRNETAADHMTSLVRSLLFFFSPSLMTVSCIIAPVWALFKHTLITDELDKDLLYDWFHSLFPFLSLCPYRAPTTMWLLDVVWMGWTKRNQKGKGHLLSNSTVE